MVPLSQASRPPLRVFLIDDHPIVRMGLAQLINDQPDMTVCGEAGTVTVALDLIRGVRPDVAVIDLSLGTSSGLDLINVVTLSHADIRVLALSMHDERVFAERALRAGAHGYVMKQQAPQDLLRALRRVADGRVYLSPQMTDRMLATATGRLAPDLSLSPVERLTVREREVFGLIAEGNGTSQIADGLHISVKTVETHRGHIKQKLGLKTSEELIRFATTWSAPCRGG